jgi:hypothetical protein
MRVPWDEAKAQRPLPELCAQDRDAWEGERRPSGGVGTGTKRICPRLIGNWILLAVCPQRSATVRAANSYAAY